MIRCRYRLGIVVCRPLEHRRLLALLACSGSNKSGRSTSFSVSLATAVWPARFLRPRRQPLQLSFPSPQEPHQLRHSPGRVPERNSRLIFHDLPPERTRSVHRPPSFAHYDRRECGLDLNVTACLRQCNGTVIRPRRDDWGPALGCRLRRCNRGGRRYFVLVAVRETPRRGGPPRRIIVKRTPLRLRHNNGSPRLLTTATCPVGRRFTRSPGPAGKPCCQITASRAGAARCRRRCREWHSSSGNNRTRRPGQPRAARRRRSSRSACQPRPEVPRLCPLVRAPPVGFASVRRHNAPLPMAFSGRRDQQQYTGRHDPRRGMMSEAAKAPSARVKDGEEIRVHERRSRR